MIIVDNKKSFHQNMEYEYKLKFIYYEITV